MLHRARKALEVHAEDIYTFHNVGWWRLKFALFKFDTFSTVRLMTSPLPTVHIPQKINSSCMTLNEPASPQRQCSDVFSLLRVMVSTVSHRSATTGSSLEGVVAAR